MTTEWWDDEYGGEIMRRHPDGSLEYANADALNVLEAALAAKEQELHIAVEIYEGATIRADAAEAENAELRQQVEKSHQANHAMWETIEGSATAYTELELRTEALATALEGIANGNWTADYMRSRAWSALDAHRAEAPKTGDAR